MSRQIFYINAVIACIGYYLEHQIVTYYVVTNAGTSTFCPALGDKLPAMVVDFMAEHEQHIIPNVRPPVAVFFKYLC